MPRLLITGCGDSMRWYADLVGQCVPLLADVGTEFKSREPAGYVNYVQYGDAVVIDDDADPALVCISELADQLEAEANDLERRARIHRYGAKDLRRTLGNFGVANA